MHEFKGTEDTPNLEASILTVSGATVPTRVPTIPPEVCPHCAKALYEAHPLTLRRALLNQLESYMSSGPGGRSPDGDTQTSVRELCKKILKAADPLSLEDAELQKLKAAVLANGWPYRDWIQELLEGFVETAAKVKETAKGKEVAADRAA